jgi:D-alanine transaminase
MPEVVYLNGQRVPREEACISIDDRGFLFGDAVYEVLRAYGGRLWAADRHFRRLRRSLQEVLIEGVDVEEVQALTTRAVEESGYPEAHVYVHITRGLEPRALAYQDGLIPTVLIHVRDASGMVSADVCEGVSTITVPDLRWRRCDIKSTNLLANALARKEAKRAGAYEAILYDEEGFITEAAAMSVFATSGGEVFTTPLGPEILPSISRELLLEMARDLGIAVREERIARRRLGAMDEVFLTSTMHEVCPVIRLDGALVRDGQVGPIATRLLAEFRARLAAGDDAPRVRP